MKNTYIQITLALLFCVFIAAQSVAQDTIIEQREIYIDLDTAGYLSDKKNIDVSIVRLGMLDLGISTYVDNEGNIDLPSEIDFLDQVLWRSINVGLHIANARVTFGKDSAPKRFGISTGVKINWTHYSMQQDYRLERNADDIFSAVDFNVPELRKNRLRGTYLQIPFMLEFNSNPKQRKSSINLAIGYVQQLLLGSQYKYKTTEGEKTKSRGDFNLRKNMGMIEGRIGVGHLNFYVQYGLNDLFQDDAGPQLTPVNFGINIIPR